MVNVVIVARKREEILNWQPESTPCPTLCLSLSPCALLLLHSTLLGSTCSRPNPSLIKLSFAETQVPYDLVVVGLLQKPSAA